jgi:hypothetical protein
MDRDPLERTTGGALSDAGEGGACVIHSTVDPAWYHAPGSAMLLAS